MSYNQTEIQPHIEYHKDGSIRAKGRMLDGEFDGYWEWYRKDGTIMRSGYFRKGKQVGEWITYDRDGKIHKITKMRSDDM
jgi:antitoxin component YwqK of YwqJK toxin-antitoxin module